MVQAGRRHRMACADYLYRLIFAGRLRCALCFGRLCDVAAPRFWCGLEYIKSMIVREIYMARLG